MPNPYTRHFVALIKIREESINSWSELSSFAAEILYMHDVWVSRGILGVEHVADLPDLTNFKDFTRSVDFGARFLSNFYAPRVADDEDETPLTAEENLRLFKPEDLEKMIEEAVPIGVDIETIVYANFSKLPEGGIQLENIRQSVLAIRKTFEDLGHQAETIHKAIDDTIIEIVRPDRYRQETIGAIEGAMLTPLNPMNEFMQRRLGRPESP